MDQRKSSRARIGRALVVSAVTVLFLAVAFATGIVPLDPNARGLIPGLLAIAALDAVIGAWLLKSER